MTAVGCEPMTVSPPVPKALPWPPLPTPGPSRQANAHDEMNEKKGVKEFRLKTDVKYGWGDLQRFRNDPRVKRVCVFRSPLEAFVSAYDGEGFEM